MFYTQIPQTPQNADFVLINIGFKQSNDTKKAI